MIRRMSLPLLAALALGLIAPSSAQAACCYFSAQNADILQPAQKVFITKFRKIFTRDEMNEDLLIVPARMGEQDDNSEYQEILPTSPP